MVLARVMMITGAKREAKMGDTSTYLGQILHANRSVSISTSTSDARNESVVRLVSFGRLVLFTLSCSAIVLPAAAKFA